MIVRVALIVAVVLLAWFVLRRMAPRLAANPRMRMFFSGIGLQLFRVFLLRRAGPLALRLLRTLRFFRF